MTDQWEKVFDGYGMATERGDADGEPLMSMAVAKRLTHDAVAAAVAQERERIRDRIFLLATKWGNPNGSRDEQAQGDAFNRCLIAIGDREISEQEP